MALKMSYKHSLEGEKYFFSGLFQERVGWVESGNCSHDSENNTFSMQKD